MQYRVLKFFSYCQFQVAFFTAANPLPAKPHNDNSGVNGQGRIKCQAEGFDGLVDSRLPEEDWLKLEEIWSGKRQGCQFGTILGA